MPPTKITLEMNDRIWKVFFDSLHRNYDNFAKWSFREIDFPDVCVSSGGSEAIFRVCFLFSRENRPGGSPKIFGKVLFRKVSGKLDEASKPKFLEFQSNHSDLGDLFKSKGSLFPEGIGGISFPVDNGNFHLDTFKKTVAEIYDFFYATYSDEKPVSKTVRVPNPTPTDKRSGKVSDGETLPTPDRPPNANDLPHWLTQKNDSAPMAPPKAVEPDPKTPPRKLSDMAGNRELKAEISKLISYYKNSGHFADWGIRPPKWVLLFGPPGTGKTLAARIIADEIGIPFYALKPTDFGSTYINESEIRLKNYFAGLVTPCVVFIDEIDSLAMKRSATNGSIGSSDQKVLNTLLQIMDGFSADSDVLFLGATNLIEELDPAILRAGRFDHKIFVDYPDAEARAEIWKLYLEKAAKNIRYPILDNEVDYALLAKSSERFTGADIQEVVRRLAQDYAMGSLHSQWVKKIIGTDTTIKGLLYIAEKYREEKILNKSIMGVRSKLTLNDMAGNNGLKEELVKLIRQYRNKPHFEELGAKIPKGILLYWPPGTGKTLTAKIIAGEIGEIFYSLEATSFLSSYINESALKLKKIFQEMETPCIVFIDEIDSIAQKRSPDSKDGATLINTLLQEMDGFSEKKNILFIAATNRLESLDPAILRSGRFDLKILVDYPDLEGRKGLFEFYLRKYDRPGKKSIFSTDLDLELFAKLSERYTGADISELIRRIVSDFAVRSLETEDAGEITTDDILKEMLAFDTEHGDIAKKHLGLTP